MINLVHADLYKLRKSIALKICFLVTTICAIAIAVISFKVAYGEMEIDISSASGLSDIFLMSVIGPLMTGFLVCSDFSSKNIHDEISCGRLAIVLSKGIVFAIIIALILLPYVILGLAGFVSGEKFTALFPYSMYVNIMVNSEGLANTSGNVGRVIAVLAVSVICYIARTCIFIPIAFKLRKSVVITVIGVIFGFFVDLLLSGIEKIPVVGDLVEYLPFHYSIINMDASQGELLKITFISIIFFAIIMGITYLSFRRSEIK